MEHITFKYLNISKKDTDFGLWVNTVGFQSIAPYAHYPLKEHPTNYFFNPEKGRTLNEYQFIFISKGEGTFTSDHYNNMRVKQGKLILLFPGQWHSYAPAREKGWDEYYIGFDGPVIKMLIDRVPILVQENQILDIGLNEELENLFRRSIEAAQKEQELTQQYLVGIVMHMLGLVLSRCFGENTESLLQEKTEQAISYMNKHVTENIDIIQLASELNMSYSYFRKVFKMNTQLSPNQYFQKLKIKEAKRLIYSTLLTSKEISYRLGYRSPEYFTLQFKKHTNMSPMEYRTFAKNGNV